MLNALIVVWRESLEAMLVVGVLLAWIGRQPEPVPLRRGLWLGVSAGIGLALGLGFATFAAQSRLAGEALETFQLAMVLFASLLIVQMVLWMHRHGRQMRQELEGQATRAAGVLGLGAIAALAVAREGAETVVFLYGLGMEARIAGNSGQLPGQLGGLLLAAAVGFALAAATGWVVARGSRFLSYRSLFRASEIALLLIANALLAGGIDRLLALDWLPPLLDPVWDSGFLLEDGSGAGRILADFVGYRARPSGLLLIACTTLWLFVAWRLARINRSPAHA